MEPIGGCQECRLDDTGSVLLDTLRLRARSRSLASGSDLGRRDGHWVAGTPIRVPELRLQGASMGRSCTLSAPIKFLAGLIETGRSGSSSDIAVRDVELGQSRVGPPPPGRPFSHPLR